MRTRLAAALFVCAAASVYLCFAVVAVPLVALSMASFRFYAWLPAVIIWWSKPWLDRTILFALSRAAFGQRTSLVDLWRAQRDVWWRQLLPTFTIRRLSLWRVLTQPVYQLEGASFFRSSRRVRQVRARAAGPAALVTVAFWFAEWGLTISLVSLLFWMAPAGSEPYLDTLFVDGPSNTLALVWSGAYAAAVLALEPFYVGAGFAMYLNRRAELEAWDIEQEFRRAFAR
jgi:hypothetical protein